MTMDKRRVEEFEKIYRDEIFSEISEIRYKQLEEINLMTINARNMGQSNDDIPSTNITLNNKLVELSQIFKKAGISKFSSELEDYDFVTSSFMENAIIQDLMNQLAKSNDKLGEYSPAIVSVFKKKNEPIQALQNVSPIRKLITRIRSFFVPVNPGDTSLTEEEQNTLDTPLQ